MLTNRNFNLRPRLNRLTPATPIPSTTVARTRTTLRRLAVTALDRFDRDSALEQDAFGQRDELVALADVAPVPASASAPTAYDPYLVHPVATDPCANFPDLDLKRLQAERTSSKTRKERVARIRKIRNEYKAAKVRHHDRARQLRRINTVELSESAPSALRVTSTGWSGTRSGYGDYLDHAALLRAGVKFLPCDPTRSLHVESEDGFLLAFRSYGPPPATSEALNRFTARWNDPVYVDELSSAPSRRGGHRATLVGTTRAYDKELHLTETHARAPDLVEKLVDDPDLRTLSSFVSGMVKTHFPLVHERYQAADPGEGHPLRCRFGIFPLFCVNHAVEGSVHCRPHADWKNVAGGVCAVMAYGRFDSSKRSWLVFTDLKIAIELPHGHVAIYPSALLVHGNVDLVDANSKEDALSGKGSWRGSLVWFAQANYIVSQELGMTLTEAKAKGLAASYEDLYKVLSVRSNL